MENLKSIADQLRDAMANPGAAKKPLVKKGGSKPGKNKTIQHPEIVEAIRAFDNSQHKTMVHVRFDENTVGLMNRFKLAAEIDVTKLVAFSVHYLFETHPELKQTIKNYLQSLDL